MTDPPALEILKRRRLLGVIRAPSAGAAVRAALGVARGGVTTVEITFTVPGATAAMAELATRSDLLIGAGTVLTAAQARDAIAAGARFIVAPNLAGEVARVALDAGVLYCPGAYTTNEILAARALGAHLVKLYPVGVAGGPAYVRVIRDPLPDIPLLAAGGTTLENTVAFLDAGCVAVGLGAALCDPALVAAGDDNALEARARAFADLVAASGHARAAAATPA